MKSPLPQARGGRGQERVKGEERGGGAGPAATEEGRRRRITMENEEFEGADLRLGQEKITPLPKEGERRWERRERGEGKKRNKPKLLGFLKISFQFCFEAEIGVVWNFVCFFFPSPPPPPSGGYKGSKKKPAHKTESKKEINKK